MSETAKRVLIGSTIALGGAALGAAALYGGKRFNKWYKERNEKPEDTATATAQPKLIPDASTPGTQTPQVSSNINALDLATPKYTIYKKHTVADTLNLTPPTNV